uniref:PKD domain-containing protein n=1 Tax=Algoriphagus sp. TaxID=1872435 RepID=UPI0040489730
MLFLFVVLIWMIPYRVAAQIGFPYCEKFETASTQANTIIGGAARLVPGFLRLTSNEKDQRGYTYFDVPFPSSYGLKAEFEYFSYGGTGVGPGANTGDGFSVFLFDADIPVFKVGGFGGSLGYSPLIRVGKAPLEGLSQAYLGIGFDEFGGFGVNIEGRNGGFPNLGSSQLAPNSIVVRGPGSFFSGYPFVTGKRTMEGGPDGLSAEDQFPISSGGLNTLRVTDPAKTGYRKVFLELQPNLSGPGFFIKLTMEVTTELNKLRMVTIFDGAYQFLAPKNLKIGFAGSTGGSTNFHEIRNLIVQVAADEALQNPEGVDFIDKASCAGQENQFYITVEEVRLPNDNSSIRCLQIYPSLDAIEEESEDLCAQARCLEKNRVLIVPQGIFQASDQAGGYTFFPNESYIDQEVTVYYTITDNYGKTSQPKKITLLIKESPDPISLKVEGAAPVLNKVILCEGESVKLIGEGNEAYIRFVWKKDGEVLPAIASQELVVDTPGVYEIIGYNRQDCPAYSNQVNVKWVEYPELRLTEPAVGCLPGEPIDLSSIIDGFDSERFDYRLIGEGLDLENEALKEVSTSGQFELQVKPKGASCYSESLAIDIFIQEEALEMSFDFEVAGTGIRDDAGGGVFPDDLIQFTNLSEDRLVTWEWDFGDSTRSSEKEPNHTFGKKGEFEVILIGKDRFGCESIFTQKVSITQSFRLMVPNAFRPSDDAKEEDRTFYPKYKSIAELELSIFNQWGELIYRSSDLSNGGWDGTVNGVLQETGFYFYSLIGRATDGAKVEENGKFRLMR